MPAQILDIRCSGSTATVGFIRNSELGIQNGGIVTIVREVEQHNIILGTGSQHDAVITGGHHHRTFIRLDCFCRLRGSLVALFFRFCGKFGCLRCGCRIIRHQFCRDCCFHCRRFCTRRSSIIRGSIDRRHQAQHQNKNQEHGNQPLA